MPRWRYGKHEPGVWMAGRKWSCVLWFTRFNPVISSDYENSLQLQRAKIAGGGRKCVLQRCIYYKWTKRRAFPKNSYLNYDGTIVDDFGTSGQVLSSNGPSTATTWRNISDIENSLITALQTRCDTLEARIAALEAAAAPAWDQISKNKFGLSKIRWKKPSKKLQQIHTKGVK